MITSDLLVDWRPFFLMVAGASASLAGLLFVALSLHLRHITTSPLYRYRARLSLLSMMSVLVIASLVLIPRQTAFALGLKEIVPIVIQAIIVVAGVVELRRTGHPDRRPYITRTAVAGVVVLVGSVGDALVLNGRSIGLEILALCCLLFLVWMVFNAWALVIVLADETARTANA